MKIALVTMEYRGDPGYGGIGTYVEHLARGLCELGHDVHVISSASVRQDRTVEDGVMVHRCALSDLGRPQLLNLLPNVGFALQRIIPLWQCMIEVTQEYDLDICAVQDHLATGLWNALSDSLPMVVSLQTPFFLLKDLGTNDVPNDIGTWLLGELEKYCLRKAAALIAMSDATRAMVLTLCPLPGADVITLPNPISWRNFPDKQSYGQSSERFNIVCPGRLERRKGTHVMLEAIGIAVRKVPQIFVTFVGADTQEEGCSVKDTLTATARRLGIEDNIEFIGTVQNKEMLERFAAADAVVLPSLFDNAPLACAEALAVGAPVVGTDSGGMPEYLGGGTRGIVVQAGSAHDLASALIQIAVNTDLRSRLAKAGKEYARRDCDYLRVAAQSVKLFDRVAQKSNVSSLSRDERSTRLTQSLQQLEVVLDLLQARGAEIQQRLHAVYDEGYADGHANARKEQHSIIGNPQLSSAGRSAARGVNMLSRIFSILTNSG